MTTDFSRFGGPAPVRPEPEGPAPFEAEIDATFIGVDFGGVSHYRLMLPARALRANLFIRTRDLDRMKLVGTPDARVAIMSMPRSTEMFSEAMQILAHPDRRLIVDLDDCLRSVVEAGTHPAAADWAKLLDKHEWLIGRADLVTVTTEWLADYAHSCGAQAVRVIPNALDLERWDNLKREPRHKTKTIVGWSGSYGHEEAVAAVAPALLELLDSRDDFAMASVGVPISRYFPERIRHRFHDIGFVPSAKHPGILTQFHINIGPTLETDFYRAKSDLRALEAFASDSTFIGGATTYMDTMVQADAGWSCSSEDPTSLAHVLSMVLDERPVNIMRDRKAGLRYVREERTIQSVAPLWREAIEELL